MGTLRDIVPIQVYSNNPELALPAMYLAVQELQGRKITVVAGADVNTNMAVSGIATEDKILSVIAHKNDGTVVDDVTDEASVTSAGNIQVTTTNLTNYFVVVHWYDKSGA